MLRKKKGPMTASMISRRRFLGACGSSLVGLGAARLLGAEPMKDSIRLGMMLQGGSVAELQEKAGAIAAAGFDTVQVTFFFQPTADGLKSLAHTLQDLKLKTVAFGTYFNLFRPDDTGFMGASQAVMKLVAANAGLFDCKQFVTWSASHSARFDGADPRNHEPEAVTQLQRAIREVVLPILEPIDGRVALSLLSACARHGGSGGRGAGAVSRGSRRAFARSA